MEKPFFTGFPQILCIFYAEFDIDIGPVVRYEIPEGFVTQKSVKPMDETFNRRPPPVRPNPAPVEGGETSQLPTIPEHMTDSDSGPPSGGGVDAGMVSLVAVGPAPLLTKGPSFSSASRSGLTLFDQAADFLIPQAELKRRFVTYYTEKYKILGYPVAISGPQYRRNELTFNCAFVFRRSDKTECFEPVIRKIAELVEHMEHGIEFLVSPHKKSRLPAILAQLYLDLNQFNESRVVYPPWFDLNLKLFPTLKNPPYIYDYEVPVLVSDLAKVINNMWDMTLVNVLERINGVFHLKKIAEQCNIDLELVRSCVQHLLYYECVVLADIFKFTNIYALTADVVDTIWKTVNQEEFVAFVALPEAKPPTFHDAIRLYFDLKPGLTVARWLEKSGIASANIDIRRFLIFGQVKKLIYRIHKYPVSLHPSACFPSNVSRLFNGRYHLDAICTQLNASEAEMEEYCGKDPNLHIIYK